VNEEQLKKKVRVGIFASGRGSNARSIIEFSKQKDVTYEVVCILSNKPTAGVLDLAKQHKINSKVFNRSQFHDSDDIVEYLIDQQVDLIVLAGFLWLVPPNLVAAYPQCILNIHPALLPKYGGKGMYGHHVHEAVRDSGDDRSGMTIHFVNEVYDEGQTIFQAQCMLDSGSTAEHIGRRVLKLEHHFYPIVINGVADRMSLETA